ncbi:MAG: ABC transporter ATP-binding protein [Actinobacteria bacterium]|nr:ABC transporter ATP-binding protein [Actinomycetota bacterium]
MSASASGVAGGAGADQSREGLAISVEQVSKAFRGVAAVRDASFSVAEGSVSALIGPNGAGKTTMFDLISGFLKPDSGSVTHLGRKISGNPPEKVARWGVVRTFQMTRIFAALSVLDNMLVGAVDHPGEGLTSMWLRPLSARKREREVREQALELLAGFDLASKADERAGTLSGGQRKLLEMARALMMRPRVLLLDEPLAGVNPTMGLALMKHIEEARDRHGLTILFVEHDLETVMRHAEQVVVMAGGTVIAAGTPDLIRGEERVLNAYLGLGKPNGTVADGVLGGDDE